MRRYQPYPAYKDSGVEWLGVVPEHWKVKRLGYYFTERREKVSDKDYQPLSVTKNGVVPQLETAAKTDDGDNRKLVRAGDFVINSRSDRKGSSGLSVLDGSVSLINTVLRPYEIIYPKFAHHLLRSYPFQEEYYRYGRGIVADLWSTNYSEMRNISISLPDVTEQIAIATFLDRETAKLDTLIAKQEKLIELLQEKRQALISHAMTKGLNPGVPMKDSGLDWVGDVPAHWKILRVKELSTFTTSGPRGWSERIGDFGSLFIQSGDLNDVMQVRFEDAKRVEVFEDAEAARTQLYTGDVIVCITGAKTGNVAVCDFIPERAFINQHLCLIRPGRGIACEYLGLVLKSEIGSTYFELSQYGLKQGLSLENVRDAPVPLPPFDEQKTISEFIACETTKLDILIEKSHRSIDLMREHRTALITAAVTGKIDVRDNA